MQFEANHKCKVGETMVRNPDETKFQLQHDRLLKAAAHCFNQKGYSGTSLKDVARQLGLTDAALYYYVRNKEELVYQCYLRAADIGRDAMDRAIKDGDSGLDQVRLYIRYHLEYMLGDRGPIAIMSEIPSLPPRHRDQVLEFSRLHSLRFEALLKTGIEDGSISPCDIRMTGNAIMGAINWIPKWFHGDQRTAARVLQEFPEILSCGLRPVA
ncbi:MAG: TetR/AcrR family transcriptional regulator [Gammaproteobacteria bacterium]|nr:TetR/AcrR family transcriptional regulator [Gammaproteobacteria bacterium]MDH5302572.1 TetR/AcrR family transcriptional regulator [Gammaproteobacteria bacterium]MDH5321051.1 TetR/AcrR family transcriptional regulator [Gammaproteobacteria bacterium]